ncbi:unnamed protein product [Nippostrongylus brasiliensis]|uniref:Phlebovirus glycoprotein G2 fusion domain-containing protein n=1 Tax=Nippostrongylus brasiliensis TaxID=27835 RepID=A0A3P7BQT7_NIPBR|nr:unnamed protein product [Nippostrongylus brasiliensis]
MNTRPLTYQGSDFELLTPLRPIDFLVKDIAITYPLEAAQPDDDDPDYVPPEELLRIQTRKQAQEALASTCELTEKFWSIWQKVYLTSLRETHKLHMDNMRATACRPQQGMVVLLADPNLPRNTWKMGRISALKESTDNAVREVELKMPNGRTLRRPVNVLVPLELQDEEQQPLADVVESMELQNNTPPSDPAVQPRHQYSLRRRPQREAGDTSQTSTTTVDLSPTTMLSALTILCIMGLTTASPATEVAIHCVHGGVHIINQEGKRYEICTEGYCILRHHSPPNETLYFPPEVTLHDHEVQWKILDGTRMKLVQISCPGLPFCENVQCWLCTATMLNPECNPTAALLSWMFVLYMSVALLYTICYVPLTIGKPFRLIGSLIIIGLSLLVGIGRCIKQLYHRLKWRRIDPARNMDKFVHTPLIAVTFAIVTGLATACQEVDMFAMETNVCSQHQNNKGKCFVEFTEILKLNTYNQEACLRLVNKNTTVLQHRFLWKGLHLTCEKQSVLFTRNTIQKVIDAKRCAHAGSCMGLKCENVTTTDEIPELSEGNKYPGITRCIESCGGPGCGCFYWSSGCLFYRIYYVPADQEVYEIFRCQTWKEKVELEIQSEFITGKRTVSTVFLQPTVPQRHEQMRITLSSLTVPPMPALHSMFISNGKDTALWNKDISMPLLCSSREEAQQLQCESAHKCNCQPAENRMRCNCAHVNITSAFYEIENRLPVRRPWISFVALNNTGVPAKIPTLVTAELLLTLKGDVTTTIKDVSDTTCVIPNSIAQGCYQCVQGAVANVTCTSDNQPTRANVRCNDKHFTIPCSPEGVTSQIRFTHMQARLKLQCTVTCGQQETTFEITGILQWVPTIHESMRRIINGESTIHNEIVFPDITHIVDTIFSGYKMIVITALSFAVAIFIGYLFFWTCGIRLIVACCHLLLMAVRLFFLILRKILRGLVNILHRYIVRPLRTNRPGHIKLP